MVAGEWTGTMNLTEPQCGTDLGLLRTKAVKQADGSYKITGTKIFISAGEHDLAENIIHLVLARIEGAPAGIKGISLFVVPKFLVNADGSLGARNGVSCGSIEHKMGIHGNSTCVMNYDGATGWLIGEENKRHAGHVRDDERGAARRRRAGPRAVRGRLSERAAYAASACRAARCPAEGAGQAGRSDHRASRRAPHAADHPRLQRGGARAGAVDRAEERRRAPLQRPKDAPGGRRSHGPDDAGHEGVLTDVGFPTRCWRSRCSAATATSPSTAWSSSCAMRASP
jgi:alkylation response protein AidB-like acyl-CoA dehydrogenase